MTALMKALGIDRLSLDERLQLMEDLQEDLAASIETTDIPQSHKEELDRRIAVDEAARGIRESAVEPSASSPTAQRGF